MAASPDIIELVRPDEWPLAWPVMAQLRADLDEAKFLALMPVMRSEGYRLFVLRANDRVVTAAGLAVLTTLHLGRHLFLYDLVTDAAARSGGHGLTMLRFIEGLARQERCGAIALTSGLQRVDAHRFYLAKAGYEKTSLAFRKKLT